MLIAHPPKHFGPSSTSIHSLFASLIIRRNYRGPREAPTDPSIPQPEPGKWKKTVISIPEKDRIPPYPYGPRQWFKQADKGLYGGAVRQSGNKISKGKNEGKTRRRWEPNIRRETIFSKALNRWLNLKVTHSCMRTITKCGGLDEYLLGDKPARIKELGLLGWKLRWMVLQTPSMKERLADERRKLGLNEPPTTIEEALADEELKEEIFAEQATNWQKLKEKDERFKKHVEARWTKDLKEYELKDMVPEWEPPVLESPPVGARS